MVEDLATRRELLARDLKLAAAAVPFTFVLLWLAALLAPDPQPGQSVGGLWVYGALAPLAAVGVSLALRIWRVQRLDYRGLLAIGLIWAPAAVALPAALSAVLRANGAYWHDDYAGLPVMALFLGCVLWLGSELRIRGGVRAALIWAAALVLTATLFDLALGAESALLLPAGVRLGEAGLALVLVGALALWVPYRHAGGAWIVFPAAGFFTGLAIAFATRVERAAEGVLHHSTDEVDLAVATAIGLALAWAVLQIKRVVVDRDPEARQSLRRLRGGFLILHAITPLLILAAVAVAFHSFWKEAQDDFSHVGREMNLLSDDMHAFFNAVTGFEHELAADVKAIEADIAVLFAQMRKIKDDVADEFRRDVDFATKIVPEIAGQTVARAKAEAEKVVGEVTGALSAAFTLPPIDFGFLGKLEMPDLGIGKAISGLFHNMFAGLMPNVDLSAIFHGLVSNLTHDVEERFAAPYNRLKQMEAGLIQLARDDTLLIKREFQKFEKQVDDLMAKLLAEKDAAYAHLREMLVDFASFFYHLFVFLALLIVAALAGLLWRSLNALVIMAGRLETGWAMMVHGKEAE